MSTTSSKRGLFKTIPLGIFALAGGLVVAFNNCDGFSALRLNSQDSASLSGFNLAPEASTEFWNQARDRAGVAMTGGSSADPNASNCEIVGDFPMRTHYRNGVGPSPGGTDVPSLLNQQVASEVASGQRMVRIYTNNYTPKYASYLEDNYDSEVHSDATIKGALRYLCANGAMRVRFRQVSAPITSVADLRALIVPNEASFQVLHGLIFRKNLFTVIIPPMWNTSVSLSSLFSNGYSLNTQLVNSVGVYGALRQAYATDSRGAIGVLWNGGGATASYTVSNDAYRDFNDFAQLLVSGVGVNANKAVAMGGSRGGHGALSVASHPAVTAIRVAYVYATAPPSDWEMLTSLSSTTLPAIMPAMEGITGYVGGWRTSFRSPELGGNGQQAFFLSQTGTTNSAQLAANFSLLGSTRITKLRNNATSILLGVSSHDFIVPSVTQWRLAKTYRDAGLDIEVERHFFCGHGNCHYASPNIGGILARLNSSVQPRNERFVTTGLIKDFLVNASTGVSELKGSSQTGLDPLTVEFPRVVIPDATAPVLATGRPGTSYAIVLRELASGRESGFVMRLDSAGIARYDWPGNSIPVGGYRLIGVYEVDGRSEPTSKVITLTNLRGNPAIEIGRYDEDTRPFGRDLPLIILKLIAGQNFENAYVDPSTGLGTLMNYGVLETSREPATASDIVLVRRALGIVTPTPTPSPTATPTPTPTPTPAPVASDCGGSTSELVFDSPDFSNACRVSWNGAKVGDTVKYSAASTKGGANGSLEATCIAKGSWSFSYFCPNKTGTTCPGGRTVLRSIPNGVRECTFHWAHAGQGNAATIVSSAADHNGGLLDGTCEATGWSFGYQCPDPGVKVCSGGGATLPSASGGKACYFSWNHTPTGQSFSGKSDPLAGTANGTLMADCVNDGQTLGTWKNVRGVCP